jgi:DNA-binding XRE family transcriptional regulator
MTNAFSSDMEKRSASGGPDDVEMNDSEAQNGKTPSGQRSKQPTKLKNRLREFRIEQMMSKAELARKAGLSVLTIDRIEKGFGCRMDTKRKILKALGLKLSDREKLFQEE